MVMGGGLDSGALKFSTASWCGGSHFERVLRALRCKLGSDAVTIVIRGRMARGQDCLTISH